MLYFLLKTLTYIQEFFRRLYNRFCPNISGFFVKNVFWHTGGTWYNQYILFGFPIQKPDSYYMKLESINREVQTLTKRNVVAESKLRPVLSAELVSSKQSYDITEEWNRTELPDILYVSDIVYLVEWKYKTRLIELCSLNIFTEDGTFHVYQEMLNTTKLAQKIHMNPRHV